MHTDLLFLNRPQREASFHLRSSVASASLAVLKQFIAIGTKVVP
jgi:hypothetical protein